MSAEFTIAEAFLRSFSSATKRQRQRLLRQAPWEQVRAAAVHHPDRNTRWWLLFLLDHHANDSSTATFAAALHDRSDAVRGIALHSIACEPCKDGSVCVADVVPSLIDTLLHDVTPRLRITAVYELLQLQGRDARIRLALMQAAAADRDAVVRRCASEALQGRVFRPRKTYERSQRRHAGSRSRAS